METESTPTGSSPVERVVSAHTPGEWHVYNERRADPNWLVVEADGGTLIAVLERVFPRVGLTKLPAPIFPKNYDAAFDPPPALRDGEHVANANLIAAAPKLLAAALACMDCELGDMAYIGSDAPAEHALGLLRAAIAASVGANAK